MSLINEALKKAQAQRQSSESPSAPPPASGEPSPATAPAPHNPNGLFLLIVLTVAVLFAGGAGLITWGLLRSEPEPAPTAPIAAADPAAASPQAPSDGVAENLPPIEFKMPDAGEESATPETPNPDAATTVEPTNSDSTLAIPSETGDTPENTTATEDIGEMGTSPHESTLGTRPDPSVEAFLAQLEIRGIMSGGKKALVFDPVTQRSHAYSTGATVSNELSVKIQEITEQSISFVDHAGYVYTKRF